jgi:3-phosphoshikimate 1-carboxyvinyltransferase
VIVSGSITPPGDKSLTHRAILLGALADGTSQISGALTSLDARSMAGAFRVLGIDISPLTAGRRVTVKGKGLRGLRRPKRSLDCGNSGTAARFLLGVTAAYPFAARLVGDASLRRRPMRRVTAPLRTMGAEFVEEGGDGLPIVVKGGKLKSLEYLSPTASAQVKGALIFAGLAAGVEVIIHEPVRSRDHTERMLRALGARVDTDGLTVRFNPPSSISPFDIQVPADPSSAAFLVGAALLAESGELEIPGVDVNPTRTGFLKVLGRMGASVEVSQTADVIGEPVATLRVRPGALRATEVAPDEVPSLIDEIPLLAVLASRAEGVTVFRGVEELRVKESDRLALMARNLQAVGVVAEATNDELRVTGTDRPPAGRVDTEKDHRIAMAFAVLNTLNGAAIRLSERASVSVSYPGFFDDLRQILKKSKRAPAR